MKDRWISFVLIFMLVFGQTNIVGAVELNKNKQTYLAFEAESSYVDEPAIKEPGIEEPSTEDPSTEDPSTEESGTKEPEIKEPAIEIPAIELPEIEKPGLEPGTEAIPPISTFDGGSPTVNGSINSSIVNLNTDPKSGVDFTLVYTVTTVAGADENEKIKNALLTMKIPKKMTLNLSTWRFESGGATDVSFTTRSTWSDDNEYLFVTFTADKDLELGKTYTFLGTLKFREGINPTDILEDGFLVENNFLPNLTITADNIDEKQITGETILVRNVLPSAPTISAPTEAFLGTTVSHYTNLYMPRPIGGVWTTGTKLLITLPAGALITSHSPITDPTKHKYWDIKQIEDNVLELTRTSLSGEPTGLPLYQNSVSLYIYAKYNQDKGFVHNQLVDIKIDYYDTEYASEKPIHTFSTSRMKLVDVNPTYGQLFRYYPPKIDYGLEELVSFSIRQDYSLFYKSGYEDGFRKVTVVHDPLRSYTGGNIHPEYFVNLPAFTKITFPLKATATTIPGTPALVQENIKAQFSYKLVGDTDWRSNYPLITLDGTPVNQTISAADLNIDGKQMRQWKMEFTYENPDTDNVMPGTMIMPPITHWSVPHLNEGQENVQVGSNIFVYTTLFNGVENVAGGYEAANDSNLNAIESKINIMQPLPIPYVFQNPLQPDPKIYKGGDGTVARFNIYNYNNATGPLNKPEFYLLVPDHIPLEDLIVKATDNTGAGVVLLTDKNDPANIRKIEKNGIIHHVFHFAGEGGMKIGVYYLYIDVSLKFPADVRDQTVIYGYLTSQEHYGVANDYKGAYYFTNGPNFTNSASLGINDFKDLDDIDQDGNTDDAIFESKFTFKHIRTLNKISYKQVRQDDTNPWVSYTSVKPGASFDYKLTVENNSSLAETTKQRGVDLLPQLGDTMVSNESVPRNSEWSPTIIPGSEKLSTGVKLFSTTASLTKEQVKDTLEFKDAIGIIWSPGLIANAKTIMFEKITPTVPGEKITVEYKMTASSDLADYHKIAWNNFAESAIYPNGIATITVPAAAASKVGVTLLDSSSPTYTLQGRAWEDVNKDGVREATDKLLENVKVELYSNKGELLLTSFTDASGGYTFKGLANMEYTVGMYNPDEKYEFTKINAAIPRDNSSEFVSTDQIYGKTTVTIRDTNLINVDGGFKYGSMSQILVKNIGFDMSIKDDPGIPLNDSEFLLYDKEGSLIDSEIIITDTGGLYLSGNYPKGSYILVQSAINPDYVINVEGFIVTILGTEEEPVKVTIHNYKYSGVLQINKTDTTDGSFLENATFEITDNQGQVMETLITNLAGKTVSSKLAPGEYTVTETVAPLGYILYGNEVQTVRIKSDSITSATLDFKNTKYVGNIIVTLTDEGGAPIKHSDFGVYDEFDVLVGVITTDTKGVAIIEDLAPGEYSVKQISTPKGFEKDPTSFHITIENTSSEVHELVVTNTRTPEIPLVPIVPIIPEVPETTTPVGPPLGEGGTLSPEINPGPEKIPGTGEAKPDPGDKGEIIVTPETHPGINPADPSVTPSTDKDFIVKDGNNVLMVVKNDESVGNFTDNDASNKDIIEVNTKYYMLTINEEFVPAGYILVKGHDIRGDYWMITKAGPAIEWGNKANPQTGPINSQGSVLHHTLMLASCVAFYIAKRRKKQA